MNSEKELQERIDDLRTHYLRKPRRVTLKRVGKSYERKHKYNGKILVQEYKLSNSKRVFLEFVIL